jgi:hypothetical protein
MTGLCSHYVHSNIQTVIANRFACNQKWWRGMIYVIIITVIVCSISTEFIIWARNIEIMSAYMHVSYQKLFNGLNWITRLNFVTGLRARKKTYVYILWGECLIDGTGGEHSNHCSLKGLWIFLEWLFKLRLFVQVVNRLCGLVVRVSDYRSRGPEFDSRPYQIFWEVGGLDRGPLSPVRTIEELLEWKSSGSGIENRD